MWVTLVLRYWKYLVGAVLVFAIWFAVHHYGATKLQEGIDLQKKADAVALDIKHKEDIKELDRLSTLNKTTVADLENLQHDLAIARATRVPTFIRVCNRTDNRSAVPTVPGGGPEVDARLSGGLHQSGDDGASTDFDLGPLYSITDEANEEHAECSKLKSWLRGIPRQPIK